MTKPRRVCVVTGSRAEWGLLRETARGLRADPGFALSIVATGAHLEARFGSTVAEIEKDGFAVDARVPLGLGSDTRAAIAAAAGRAVAGLAEAFARLAPDVVLLLGDRYEILAAAWAAHLLGVPVAHVHGGEITEGAFDDAMRHAITKLAVLHFAAAEPYRQRIIQMGEAPERVFTVGAPGADAVANLSPLPDAELARATGCALKDPILLVTYHPTTARRDSGAGIAALLAALDGFPDAALVFTGVNADPGGSEIAAAVRAWTGRRGAPTAIVESLGQAAYLSLMRQAAAVVGNSSSGIIEAPASGVPSVDIGDRQKGRLRASSVLACPEDAGEISAAIATAMSPAFRSSVAGQALPYGGGGAATRIVAALRRTPSRTLAGKTFHDLARPAA